jgi:hypothetical protein
MGYLVDLLAEKAQILLPRIADGSMKFAFAHTEPVTCWGLNRVQTISSNDCGLPYNTAR